MQKLIRGSGSRVKSNKYTPALLSSELYSKRENEFGVLPVSTWCEVLNEPNFLLNPKRLDLNLKRR